MTSRCLLVPLWIALVVIGKIGAQPPVLRPFVEIKLNDLIKEKPLDFHDLRCVGSGSVVILRATIGGKAAIVRIDVKSLELRQAIFEAESGGRIKQPRLMMIGDELNYYDAGLKALSTKTLETVGASRAVPRECLPISFLWGNERKLRSLTLTKDGELRGYQLWGESGGQVVEIAKSVSSYCTVGESVVCSRRRPEGGVAVEVVTWRGDSEVVFQIADKECSAIAASQRYIVACCTNGSVHCYDRVTKQIASFVGVFRQTPVRCEVKNDTAIACSYDKNGSKNVAVIDLNSRKVLAVAAADVFGVFAACFSPTGKELFAIGDEGVLRGFACPQEK